MATNNDTIFYPYYGNLNDKVKEVYKSLYNAILAGSRKCAVNEKIMPKDAFTALKAIYNDHPEIFWIDGSCRVETINGYVSNIEPEYNSNIIGLAIKQSELKRAIQSYLSGLNGIKLIDQERIIHDKMTKNISYVKNGNDQNAYGALVLGKAVCAGYSRGFQLLMQYIGIPCYYVSGVAIGKNKRNWENHAWNIIKLGNEFYNMDLTWDDCYDSSSDNISYTYYNCTDSSIATNHKRDAECAFLPRCNGTTYSFEHVNGVCSELEIIYQDRVTNREVVENQQDFIKVVMPILHSTSRGTTRISFPVKGRTVVDNAMNWFEKGMNQYSSYIGGWRIQSNITDYKNGWYRMELTIILS